MQWGPQRAFYNFFFPGRYAGKEAPGKTNQEPQSMTSITCSANPTYSDMEYYLSLGVPNLPTLETIAEDEEYEDESDDDSSCKTPCQKRSTSNSPTPDTGHQILVDCGSRQAQPPPPSTGENENCKSESLRIPVKLLQRSGVEYGVFSPASVSSDSQDTLDDEDYRKLADIVGNNARYQLLEERIAGERNVRLAIDHVTNKKVILIVYKSDVAQNRSGLLQRFEKCKHLPKVLNTVRVADGRSLLVLEYGNFTLSEWMKTNKHDYPSRKAVVSEVLEAFVCLHGQGIRSGKIKPSLLVWYSSDQSWKMLGPFLSLEVGSKGCLSHSRRYAAPELLQNEERMLPPGWKQQDSDMWSFGVIAYEILTGRRFHDPTATLEAVGKKLIGKRPLPSLSRIPEQEGRKLLKKLLSLDPRERPTAKQTSESAYFKPIRAFTSTRAILDGFVAR